MFRKRIAKGQITLTLWTRKKMSSFARFCGINSVLPISRLLEWMAMSPYGANHVQRDNLCWVSTFTRDFDT